MARYVKVLPVVDTPANTFNQIQQYLTEKGFHEVSRDGEQVFQKGKGFWVAPSFIKITYSGNCVRVEAWVDTFGAEHGLEGAVAVAAKGAIKKAVPYIESVLSKPGMGYIAEPLQDENANSDGINGENAHQNNFCVKCGAQLSPEGKFCASCGHIVGEPLQRIDIGGFPEGKNISKKEYLKKYAGDSFYMNLRVISICGYVLSGILALTVLVNPFSIIDLVIYLGLTLGMHLGKSKGCSIAILVYSALSMILILVLNGSIGGWGWLAVGITSLIVFNNAEKRYKKLVGNQ